MGDGHHLLRRATALNRAGRGATTPTSFRASNQSRNRYNRRHAQSEQSHNKLLA
jgi:hypothetical protein